MVSIAEKNISEFWYKEENEVLVGASCEKIALTESRLGVKLPQELKMIYKESNGGCPFLVLRNSSASIQNLLPCFGAMDALELSSYTKTGGYDYQEAGIPENLVILGSHGHDYFALDYRKSKINPKVVYAHEGEDPIVVANTFFEFLSMLYNEYD